MSNIGHLKNQILAISVATVLVYAVGIAIPTLTATPAFATNYDDKNDKHYDNKNKHDDNNKHYDNKNKHYDDKNYDYKSQFLNDVEQCFPDSGNHDEQFSDDVKECIYDVIAAYFDDDTNNNSHNDDSNTGSTSTSNGNRLGMGNGIGSLLSS